MNEKESGEADMSGKGNVATEVFGSLRETAVGSFLILLMLVMFLFI